MKRRVNGLACGAFALCLNAAISGQTPSPAAGQPAATAQPEGKPTTIVGCLVDRLPNKDGSATTKADTGTDTYYVRTPAVKVPAGASVAVGSPGTPSTATSVGTPAGQSFYRIMGLNDEALSPHLGHRVEIRGHLTDNMPGQEAQRATTKQDKDGRATTTVETWIAVAGVLHATEIKMVSADCGK